MLIFHYEDEDVLLGHMMDSDTSGLDFPLHIHDNYELYCFVSGDAHYMVEGRVWKLEYGSTLLIKPGESHRLILDSSKPYERYTLNFSANALPGEFRELLNVFDNFKTGEKTFYSINEFSGITPLDLFSVACDDEAEDVSLLIRSLMPAFLSVLKSSRQSDKKTTLPRSDVAKMVDWINKHLADPITLSDVAEKFHRSVSQTERIFKAATGTSVGKYCQTKRLLAARQMIVGGKSAEAACYECGFKDYSAFFRLFKKQFGCAPSHVAASPVQKTEMF